MTISNNLRSGRIRDEWLMISRFLFHNKKLIISLILISLFVFSIQWSSVSTAYFLIDFLKGYYPAARAIIEGDVNALARLIETAGFVNIPIFASLFVPLAWFGLKISKIIFLLLGFLSIAISFIWMWRRLDFPLRVFLIPLFLGNGPLWNSIIIGNITHFVLLVILLSISLLEARQNFLAGFLLGVAVIMKPMIFLFGIYFLWRRNFSAVAGGAACLALTLACSLIFLGVDLNLFWFNNVLIGYAGKAMGVFNMESINAFVLRLWIGPELLDDWKSVGLSPVQAYVKFMLLAALVLPGLFVFWRLRRADRFFSSTPQDRIEFGLVMILCIVSSPIAWTHYYLLLLVVWFLLGEQIFRSGSKLASSIFLTSIAMVSFPVLNLSKAAVFLGVPEWIGSRSVQSIWLFGAVLLFMLLLFMAANLPRYGKEIEGPIPRV